MSTSNFLESETSQVLLLKYLGTPYATHAKRCRWQSSKIKVLYGIYNFSKKANKEGWKEVFPSKDTLAKGIGIGRSAITEFINSEEFCMFGEVIHRKFKTNLYSLQDWVIKLFRFFEVNGMMQKFKENFREWKRKFTDRLTKWLLPKLEAGLSLKEVINHKRLVNSLSTEKALKTAATESLKTAAIKSTLTGTASFMKPAGTKSNFEPQHQWVQNVEFLGAEMFRFGLREGDINILMSRYNQCHHKRACKQMELWRHRGMEIQSPVRVYQTCLNMTRI